MAPDYSGQQDVIQELRKDELMVFLPLGMTLAALFSLGYATWLYLVDERLFAIVMTAVGASSIVSLVLGQQLGRKLLLPMQLLFGIQAVAIGQLVVLFCPVGENGFIGGIAVVPALVIVCGFRLGSVLLTLHMALLAGQFFGWLPWRAEQYSPPMVRGLLFGSAAVGLFLAVAEAYRDRSRNRLVEMGRAFSRIASRDELSGLPNRREMERLLGNRINRYHLSGEGFSIIVCDIDNYKQFNDSFGHQFGDQLVKAVSAALQSGLHSGDIVARWGGDEFLVLLGGQKIEAAQQLAERLRRNVASLRLEASGEIIQSVTMSFGLACMEGHENADDLISTANQGLYQAKHMGRDMVVAG